MKLPHDAKSDAYRASGAWGWVSLDMLVTKAAQGSPDRVALADGADRADWTGGAARTLTFWALEEEVAKTAAAFRLLGLETGTVIGLFAPNTVDTVVAFLGALRAGLIVAPIPLTWRASEIVPALEIVGAKALLTAGRLEDAPLAEIARDAAIEIFGVRFVFGIGDDLPDGVAPLAMVRDALEDNFVAPIGPSADHVATLTWSTARPGDPVPLPRSHNHWIAAGLMHLLEGRIEAAANIHSAFAPTGIVGIGAVLVPWLLSGGTLNLHHYRTLDGLVDAIARSRTDLAVVPGGLVDPIAGGLARTCAEPPALSAVWRDRGPGDAQGAAARRAAIDLTVLDEFAFIASWRGGTGQPEPLPLGEIAAPRGTAGAPVLAETRLVGRPVRGGDETADLLDGEVSVTGAMVPSTHWPGGRAGALSTDDAGFVRTGMIARPLATATSAARIVGRDHGAVAVGGAVVHLGDLDPLLAETSPKNLAAACALDDPVVGHRLAAAIVGDAGGVDPATLAAALDGKNVALHKRPAVAGAVGALPVDTDGAVNRAILRRSLSSLPTDA